ncbi:helix-turn-helix domain-containing protein [Asticcacaulis solisilvae]|uniref:helix-turn-helix domain-containing protein n=1 Tax=Asticcacaulis solisilvae TaxID=1217274 RepID=UPI003FD77795
MPLSNPTTAGQLLRQWRDLRGKSQLDLALDTGISQKHVSFVETGRSTPSRQMIVDLSDALDVPLRERNIIMTAAGHAPVYGDEPLTAPAMQAIAGAVRRMLKHQDPFPAVVMDRYWNVIDSNDAAPAFFGRFIDLGSRPKPRNLLHLMFDPAGLRPCLTGFEDTARSLLSRIRREATGGVPDAKTHALIADLMSYPDVPQEIEPAPQDIMPMIPLGFRTGEGVINLFSMITTVGTPQTITAQEIRIETMFPADDDAERAYLHFMRDA